MSNVASTLGGSFERATEGSFGSLSWGVLGEIMTSLGVPEEDMDSPRFLNIPVE